MIINIVSMPCKIQVFGKNLKIFVATNIYQNYN